MFKCLYSGYSFPDKQDVKIVLYFTLEYRCSVSLCVCAHLWVWVSLCVYVSLCEFYVLVYSIQDSALSINHVSSRDQKAIAKLNDHCFNLILWLAMSWEAIDFFLFLLAKLV